MDYTLKCLKPCSKTLRTKYRKICLRYHYRERFSKVSIKKHKYNKNIDKYDYIN